MSGQSPQGRIYKYKYIEVTSLNKKPTLVIWMGKVHFWTGENVQFELPLGNGHLRSKTVATGLFGLAKM